jgi:ATP-dependent Clp protease ATP-binding subunit ClpB
MKYGARHLKRAIERLLVQPLSNLIATDQIRTGDCIRVDFSADASLLIFLKEAEGVPIHTMAELVDDSVTLPAHALATGAIFEPARAANARFSRRG